MWESSGYTAHLPNRKGLGPANDERTRRQTVKGSEKQCPTGEHIRIQEKDVSRRRETIRMGVQRWVLAWLYLNLLCGLG